MVKKESSPTATKAGDESLTVIIKRRAKSGKEAALEKWFEDLSLEATLFPGYLGTQVIKPVAPDNPEYVVILRFDSYENLDRFYDSDIRAEFLRTIRDLTVGDAEIRRVQGMHYWLDLSELTGRAAPPKWKMALIIFISLYPLGILLSFLLGGVIGGLHDYLRRLISTGLVVAIMTWIVMPFLTRLLRPWLFRN